MRRLTIFFLLMFSFNAFAVDLTVKVSGMVCTMCAQGIQKKFSSIPEVEKLNVDMDEKVVHIKMKEGKDLSDEVIKKLITEAGYNVASIERK
jgi:periplasmic mercuric ion binding protein